MDEQLAFVKEIARRLEDAGVPYMVTGSLALAAYGIPRMTRDIDIVLDVAPQDAERLTALLEGFGYVDADAVRQAIARRGMFNVIHERWFIKADFIVRKDDLYRVEELSRRRFLRLGEARVAVVSPEDLLLSKLVWGRASGSELQRRDVQGLVRSVDRLDWAFLRRWARHPGRSGCARRGACVVNDTPETVARRYRRMILQLTPGERFTMATRMFRTGRALVEAGIRAESAGKAWEPEALRRAVFARMYAGDLSPDQIAHFFDHLDRRRAASGGASGGRRPPT